MVYGPYRDNGKEMETSIQSRNEKVIGMRSTNLQLVRGPLSLAAKDDWASCPVAAQVAVCGRLVLGSN